MWRAWQGGAAQPREWILSTPCRVELSTVGSYAAWHENYVCIFISPALLVCHETQPDSSLPPGRSRAGHPLRRVGQMLARESADSSCARRSQATYARTGAGPLLEHLCHRPALGLRCDLYGIRYSTRNERWDFATMEAAVQSSLHASKHILHWIKLTNI